MPVCKTCVDAVRAAGCAKGYDITVEEAVTILWEATAYPAGCGDVVAKQAKEFFAPGGEGVDLYRLRSLAQDRIEREYEVGR